MIASGGPNAATYMWYSDIAIAIALISQRSATLPGVVAGFSSETITGEAASDTCLAPLPDVARRGERCRAAPPMSLREPCNLLHRANFLVLPGRTLVEWNADIDGHVLGGQAGDGLDDRRHVADVRGHRLGHLIDDVLRQVARGHDVRRVANRRHVIVLLRIVSGLYRQLVIAGVFLLQRGHRLVIDGNHHDVARTGQIHDR